MSDDFTTRETNVPRSNLWPYRLWREQAAILYPGNPERQRLAVLDHLTISMHCTSAPNRWLWLTAIGARLVETPEVHP